MSDEYSKEKDLVMTSQERTSIIDQIIFYFQIKKTVNDHLSKHFPSHSPQLLKFTNQLSSEIKDSYKMMHNSLMGIAMTPDNELWIKTKIDFNINSINNS